MPFIVWNTGFATGVDRIDADHRHIMGIINTLHDAVKPGTDQALGFAVLDELARYVEDHFELEERMMEACAFPELPQHRAEHHLARTTLLRFRNAYLDGRLVESLEVLEFLRDWLGKHILGTDLRYVPFIHKDAGPT